MSVAKKSALKVTVALFLSASLIGSSVFAFGGGNSGTVITGTGGTNTNRPPRPVNPAPVVVSPAEPTVPATPPVTPTEPPVVVAPTEPTTPVVDPTAPVANISVIRTAGNPFYSEFNYEFVAIFDEGDGQACFYDSCSSQSNSCVTATLDDGAAPVPVTISQKKCVSLTSLQ